MFRTYCMIGAITALLAVALGAFGAHGLKDTIDPYYLEIYETGVQYHMMHALGLILIGLASDKLGSSNALLWSGRLLAIGILIFSGSLYLLSITKVSILGAITPIGGVAFIVGWALFARAAFKNKSE